MKTNHMMAIAVLAIAIPLTSHATIITSYNQTVTFPAGTGNSDIDFVKSENTDDHVATYVRVKDRLNGDASNVLGVYTEPTGLATPTRGYAQFEFVLDADTRIPLGSGDLTVTRNLSRYNWWGRIDTDPTAATSFITIDLLSIPDNAYAHESTPNGGGVVGPSFTLAPLYDRAANSENQIFFMPVTTIGIYDVEIYATAVGVDADGVRLTDAHARLLLGDVPNVPDGGSTAGLSMLGVGALAAIRRKTKR